MEQVIRVLQKLHALKGGLSLTIINLDTARREVMDLLGIEDVKDPHVIRYTIAIEKLQELIGSMET